MAGGLALLLVLLGSLRVLAHDLPGDVLIQMVARAEGDTFRLVLRVPLDAMQDIDFPLRGGDYLDIANADAALEDSVSRWIAGDLHVYENGRPLEGAAVAMVASIPSDPSFASFDRALAHVRGPRLADSVEIPWQQVMLDVLFEYPITSTGSRFSLEPTLARLGLRTRSALRFVLPGGTIRAFDYTGNPGVIQLDPRWSDVVRRFVNAGATHIFDGPEHLLFLACLVIPFRRLRPLIAIVTAFTAAHSVALIAASYGLVPRALWFPPLVDLLVAASILYMAAENVLRVWPKERWLLAFAFGLAHGFAFSFGLAETRQFAGGHQLGSIVAFNIGIEIAQVLVIAALLATVRAIARFADSERMAVVVLSLLAAHPAWHWLTLHAGTLARYDIRIAMPAFDAALLGEFMRWGMVGGILLMLVWLMSLVFPRLEREGRSGDSVSPLASGQRAVSR